MTVLIYVDTSKQVGDLSTSRSLRKRRGGGLVCEDDTEGVAFEYEVIGSPARTGGQEKAAAG